MILNDDIEYKFCMNLSFCVQYKLKTLLELVLKYSSLKVFITGNYNVNPNPKLTPKCVVTLQLSALKHDNIPHCYKFASENNKSFTGPLSKFSSMIHRSYFDMINFDEMNIDNILARDMMFSTKIYRVYITKDKITKRYDWLLKKESNNCWMTDGVG